MSEPSETKFSAARALGVSLYFGDAPLAIARLCEVVADLEARIALLERRKSSWLLRK
jgi:hypothetical protein